MKKSAAFHIGLEHIDDPDSDGQSIVVGIASLRSLVPDSPGIRSVRQRRLPERWKLSDSSDNLEVTI